MNLQALITMILAQGIVTFFTIYFFIKVLKTPHSKDEDLKE